MAATYVPASAPLGSYAASIIYSKALLARMITQRTFRNKITGPMPLDSWMTGIDASETSRGYPVVSIMDLMKNAGDQVTIDIVNRIGGKPVMGDNIAKNSGVPIDIGRDVIQIDQYRKVIDAGGRIEFSPTLQ